jgi:TPR repeat protein
MKKSADLPMDRLGMAFSFWNFQTGRNPYNTDGVPQDANQSATYFRMSANQGHALGQYYYGLDLLKGEAGVKRNLAQAVKNLH